MRYPALAMLLAELGRARGAPLPLAPVVEGVGAAVEGIVPAESPEVDVAVLVGRSPVGQIERPRSSIRRPRAEDGGGEGGVLCRGAPSVAIVVPVRHGRWRRGGRQTRG
jgi:hypothetical protein